MIFHRRNALTAQNVRENESNPAHFTYASKRLCNEMFRVLSNLKIVIFVICLFHITIFSHNVTADLIIINAKIYTMNSKQPQVEAVAIFGSKISKIGTDKEIKSFAGAKTKTIDARGKLVLPGFNDSHVHFMGIGNQFSSLDLRDAKTPQEIVRRLAYYVRFLPKGRWILGGGWNHENWMPNDLPSKELIDAATPENPVFLYHSNPKTALANSLALRLAGIDNNSKIAGLTANAKGEPTGILQNSALGAVKKIIPEFTTKQWHEVAETASNYAASLGVTSVQDMSADNFLDVYRRLDREGKLKTRIYDCTNLFKWETDEIKPPRAGDVSIARGGCLKSFSDGDVEAREKLYNHVQPADKAGFQIMIHAIGGNANQIALGVFEQAAKANGARDRRFRVEHAHNPRREDLPRFGKSKIIASMQPYLFFGGARTGSEPYRALLDTNAALAFGSDASITEFNPLLGIHAAVNAQRFNGTDSVQTISVEEAVRAYTLGSAYAEFQENVKGAIAVGKLADLIILSDDIFSISPDEIPNAKVLTTIVDGKVVYEYK